MKIFIDAGHRNTYYDKGCSGNGLLESEVVLKIVNKLSTALLGKAETKISRHTESDVASLAVRCEIANIWGADLFVSIHANHADSKDASGVEVWYYDQKALSKNICDYICKSTGAKNRGPKQSKEFIVLNSTKMPAVLVEIGFLSNSAEASKLSDGLYLNNIVDGIVKGLGFEIKDQYQEDVEYIANELKVNVSFWYPPEKINIKNIPPLMRKMATYIKNQNDKGKSWGIE